MLASLSRSRANLAPVAHVGGPEACERVQDDQVERAVLLDVARQVIQREPRAVVLAGEVVAQAPGGEINAESGVSSAFRVI